MTGWLDSEDFPSGPGGIAADQYSTWVHPKTQVVYFWDVTKNSWKTLNSPGARMYSDTIDPALNGYTLQDGDMWWDQQHCELRVFHKPLPLTSEQYVEGRWVSSTNPQMTPEDVNRNMIIGTITIDGVSAPYEEEEVVFSVSRNGGAPDSKVDYQWRSSPPSITLNTGTVDEVTHTVQFTSPNSSTTMVRFPKGTAVFDGDFQVAYNISCRITAKEEYEDEFVKTSANSPSIAVRPIPLEADPVQYINMALGVDQTGTEQIYTFTAGSSATTMNRNGDSFETEVEFLKPNFFIVPSGGVIVPEQVHFSTKPKDESTINDEIGVYAADYGPISEIAGDNATGYLMQLSGLNTTSNLTVYVWNDFDDTTGTLILTP